MNGKRAGFNERSFHYKLYRPQVICSAVIFQHAIWIFHCFQISTWLTYTQTLWCTAFKEMQFILEYPGALARCHVGVSAFLSRFSYKRKLFGPQKKIVLQMLACHCDKNTEWVVIFSTKCLFQRSFKRLFWDQKVTC